MNQFWASCLGGGLAGAVVTLIVQKLREDWRIWNLSNKLECKPDPISGSCRVRVHNNGIFSIEDAIGYITLDFDSSKDVVDGMAFIKKGSGDRLCEDRLCWAEARSNNPFQASIFPGENQTLDVVRFHETNIEIPSEQGWSHATKGTQARVFLSNNPANKVYKGRLTIVAKNLLRRNFTIEIDPINKEVKLDKEQFIGFFDFWKCK